nr:integrase, catalytic region, zinc finger, CCHC-type, peptidase aspartic, catalytic [Tanacetum cinerariifolium]
MQTRSSSRLIRNPSSNPTPSTNPNPKGRNRRRSKQRIKEFNLDELSPPIVMMADQRTMAQLLQAPTEGYEDVIVIPVITADNFELNHGLLTLVRNKQYFGHDKEDPHAHIRYFNKITSTLKFPNVPNTFKDLLRACPQHGFSELHQLDTFYNALNSKDQDSLNFAAGATDGNIFRDNIQEFVSQASAVNYNHGNTSYRPSMMSNQIRPPGFPPIPNNQNVQLNQRNNQNRFNQNQNRGNNFNHGPVCQPPVFQPSAYQAPAYQAPAPQTQGVSMEDFSAYFEANDAVIRNMQTQGQNMQNQLTNLTDLLTKFVNSNNASTSSSGTLPSNTIANPRSDLKAITTRSGVSYNGSQIPPRLLFFLSGEEGEQCEIVQLILLIVDSGCTKHMTGNLKLLCNFVEKFLGTVRFGNDQFAPILGYGDLVQGNVTINRVYYVKGLNHNLFLVGQFCDVDLEVAFRKSTCFVRDL